MSPHNLWILIALILACLIAIALGAYGGWIFKGTVIEDGQTYSQPSLANWNIFFLLRRHHPKDF